MEENFLPSRFNCQVQAWPYRPLGTGLLRRGGVAGPAADPLPLPVLPSATLHSPRPWLPWSLINQAGRPLSLQELWGEKDAEQGGPLLKSSLTALIQAVSAWG